MASSKSLPMVRILIGFLALWFIVSLILILVWAISPNMKGESQCNAELQTLKDEFDKKRLTWDEDRRAMETMVWQGRTNQSLLLNWTRQLQEQSVLKANITSLENETELLKASEASLTEQVSQQQDLIEYLQHNLTQTASKLKACIGLHAAAQILQQTAETETVACHTNQQYLQKQLSKCKQMSHTTKPKDEGPTGASSSIALLIVLGIVSFLIP
ncbi:uncharacterized protein si:ch211-1a19.3 isoform X2 [Electrophorus electricus]|uniref:uncharacterized protein si:ch211-1a19.3 isoform X2 n=1 Tax=Electrophorus electricus TaxID=8005 RepID=UPI0015CFFE45|nr:uncharacterized protein si:ch211-1a19.3 isoform X2 [Electrophorus electricus]